MKIAILGAGPAGLYCGLLMKKANSRHEITIVERNPADATYGWGVVFSERTLSSFRDADPRTHKEITDRLVVWDAIDTRYRGEVIRAGGQGFSGISRKVLLNILQRRCDELGVNLRFQTEVDDLSQFREADLLIAADGINSLVRKTYADVFRPSFEVGKAKYIWLGSCKVLDCFTFIFRVNEHGLFQVHSYPFDGNTSTFIVECEEEVWRRAGLDQADEAASLAYCERLLADDLSGQPLLSNKSIWINFVTLKNETWHHENVVLVGDAAHTAHFSIGSGTKLAMEDSVALANAFEQHSDVETALNEYEMERKPKVEAFQQAARESRIYFENLKRYLNLEPMQFTFQLLTRSGRISYDDLRLRDAYFVDAVDRWFADQAAEAVGLAEREAVGADVGRVAALPRGGRREQSAATGGARDAGQAPGLRAPADGQVLVGSRAIVAPSPMLAPYRVRGVTLANRVVLRPIFSGPAIDGLPGETHLGQLRRRALGRAGLVMTEPVAVSPEGRITPVCAGLYESAHGETWARIVDEVHQQSGSKVGIQLGHAGRRGSTRPRWEGLDKPLREGNWQLFSASAIPITPRSQVPTQMDRAHMDAVRDAFVRSASMARETGFDLLQLHFGHGYLLASFISPLTNRRDDAYGGPLENRLRYPLEVLDAVRAVWPEERPLSVAFTASDCARGGLRLEEAVEVARVLKAHGCDLVEVLAGQTTVGAEPPYGRRFLTPLSEQIRNEADVPTMVAGYITTTDEANTIVAAGRADLCVMDPPGLRA